MAARKFVVGNAAKVHKSALAQVRKETSGQYRRIVAIKRSKGYNRRPVYLLEGASAPLYSYELIAANSNR